MTLFPTHISRLACGFTSLRTGLLATLACAALLTSGCHKKSNIINPSSLGPASTSDSNGPAPTATLTADPLAIDQGQSVVLNWRTSNANSVTIEGIGPVAVNGTQTVSPTNSTNFHLVAKGDGGSTEANVRITVRVPTTSEYKGTTMGPNGGSVTDEVFHASVKDVFFDYDSMELRPDGETAVTAAAAFLKQHPDLRVLIGGYADERGSAEYNLALGESRAKAAQTGLVQAGIGAGRIRVISYGKEKQFCTEANESCWQENRRAQFTIDR